MKIRFLFLGATLPISLLAFQGAEVHAQRGNAFGGQGSQQGGLGATLESPFGAVGGQGQLGLGQQSLGQPGLGQPGLGQQGPGRPGRAGQQGSGQRGLSAGQQNQAQRRVGGQDGFVGSDAQQVQNQAVNGRAGRRAMFDFAVESLNEMRAARNEARARRNEPAPVRVRLRPLFTVRERSALELTAQVSRQLGRSLPSSLAATTQVTVRGNIATIQGTASSEYDKQLAAKMISLQPGISQIENQLVIDPSPRDSLSFPLP